MSAVWSVCRLQVWYRCDCQRHPCCEFAASAPSLLLRAFFAVRAGLTLGRLDRVGNSCLVNRVGFGHRVVLRLRDRAPCAVLPPPKAPLLGEALSRPLALCLSATNDVSMNASFVVEVQSNERSSGAMPWRPSSGHDGDDAIPSHRTSPSQDPASASSRPYLSKLKSDNGGDHCATSSGDSGGDGRRLRTQAFAQTRRIASLGLRHGRSQIAAYDIPSCFR